jgi:hypothetical protein
MRRSILAIAVAALLAAGLALAAQKDKSESWVGWITDSQCATKGDPAKHTADCCNKCVKQYGAKYVLFSPSDKKVYQLDPQDKAEPHAGKHVKVSGTVSGDSIKVASIEPTGEQKGKDKKGGQ